MPPVGQNYAGATVRTCKAEAIITSITPIARRREFSDGMQVTLNPRDRHGDETNISRDPIAISVHFINHNTLLPDILNGHILILLDHPV